jgi:hypothetical protein
VLLTLKFFPLMVSNTNIEQVSGVAMGTKMGPNYANLFVGYVD